MVTLRVTRDDGSPDELPISVFSLRDGSRLLGLPRTVLADALGVPPEALNVSAGAAHDRDPIAADAEGGESLVAVANLPYALMVGSAGFSKRNSAMKICSQLMECVPLFFLLSCSP